MKKVLASLLSVCLLAISLSPISAFATAENNFLQANDYSVLSDSGWHEASDGVLSENDTLFTTGIWADSRESLGIDETKGQTMVKGMLPQDSDSDTRIDRLLVATWKDVGAYVTFGFNKQTDFTGATALAVHLDCLGSRPNWNEGEIGNIKFTLYDTNGNAYEMASQSEVSATAKSYFINVGVAAASVTSISTQGYAQWNAKSNGWYIVDLAAFGNTIDISKLSKVKIAFDTRWDSYTTFGSIGFVKDVNDFAYDIAGIELVNTPVYDSAVDYSGLSHFGWLWAGDGKVDPNHEIFNKGIWADSSDTLGLGAGTVNTRGLLPEDSNSDGKIDRLVVDIVPDGYITIGFNKRNNFTGATAIAIHMECSGSRGTWSADEIADIALTLYDTSGKAYEMLNPSLATADTSSYNMIMDNNTIVAQNAVKDGYCGFKAVGDSWFIVDISAFGSEIDLSKLAKVKIAPEAKWDNYTTIGDIGFVYNMQKFVKSKIGISDFKEPEAPVITAKPVIPSETGYRQALNLQELTPGMYRDTEALGWAGIIPTDAEIITKGIWVDPEGAKGLVAADSATNGKTNIHGFIAEDYTNDGKTDTIAAIPNNNSGVEFTLGFNTKNSFEGASAAAIRIDCDDMETDWSGAEELWIKLTFYDSEDNEYPILAREDIAERSAYSYYVTLDDKNIVKRDVNVEGYNYWKGNRDGWYIIDLAAYGEYFYAEDMVKVKISAASWWESNMVISDIAFLDNADDFVYYLVNDEVYTPAAKAPQIFAKGSSVIKLVGEDGCKYRLGDGKWSDSTVFEGLILGEIYTVYSYIPATSSANESAVASTTVTLYLEGDTDHNGVINSTDIADVRKHILGNSTAEDVFAADANLDGGIDILDLIRIKKSASE